MLSQLIFLPSMMLGGLMVPVSMLPKSLAKIAMILPTTHLMQAYAGYAYGGHGTQQNRNALASVVALAANLRCFVSHFISTT